LDSRPIRRTQQIVNVIVDNIGNVVVWIQHQSAP
jgi:hypothetical protein